MEFALVAPILFALVFGIFDFGRCMSANVTVTNSAREGARYAATHTTSTSAGTVSGSYGRWGFECPNGSPLGDTSAATGAAWRQLSAANLDLTQVTMTVSYYASTNDPANDTNGTLADLKQSCAGTVAQENGPNGGAVTSYTPASGDWVKVEVKYNYAPVTPFISQLITKVAIDQTAIMVLE